MTSKFVLAIVLACLLHNIEAIPIFKDGRAEGRNIRSTNGGNGELRTTVFEQVEQVNEGVGRADDLYQGDIAGVDHRLKKRGAVKFGITEYSYWPNGQVLYTFDAAFPESGKSVVHDAMRRIESVTCVRFIESKDGNVGRIRIFQGEGCSSHIGYKEGITRDLSLGNGCGQKPVVLHELMHVLGFWHEQSRTDRDDNVIIMMENVQEGKEHNFEKSSADHSQSFSKYDIHSITHYGKLTFSKNGKPTIVSKVDANEELGQDLDLSVLDIADINAAYRCTAPVDGQWSEWSYFTSCSVSCGEGTSYRLRYCNSPAPLNGGNDCQGENEEVKTCSLGNCPSFICDFDNGLCKWSSKVGESAENTLKWTSRRTPTPSAGTGPVCDHSSGEGNYLYMETSSPAQGNHHALLRSDVIPRDQYKCLTVWIHMYGQGMGSLQVKQRNVISKEETVLRSFDGDHGDTWIEKKIPIDSSFDSEIEFKGIRANSWKGDMAIDDIKFSTESCEPAPYNCDFEGWQCNWLSKGSKNFAWKRHHAGTPSSNTGPSKAQSGAGYMYTEASSPATKGDIAVLETVKIEPARSARRCLTYSYNMFGSGTGKLRIYSIGQWGGTHVLNSHEGDQGAGWVQAKVSFQSWEAVTLKFEAERGSSYLSDIAIDNVKITDQNCM